MLFGEVLDILRDTQGDKHGQTLATVSQFGNFLLREKRFEEAQALLSEAVESGREVLDHDDYTMSLLLKELGKNMIQIGRLGEAEAILLESYEWGQRTRPGHQSNQESLQALADLYTRLNRLEKAAEMRELLQADG